MMPSSSNLNSMYGYIRQTEHIISLVQLKSSGLWSQRINWISILESNRVTISITNSNEKNLSNTFRFKFKYLNKL